MSQNASAIEIEKLINARKLGKLQITVMVLCGLTVLLDGFDTQSIAFVAPSIAAEWHLPHAALGPIFVASLVGLLFGTLIFGPTADKIGRRPVIMISTLVFGGFTLLTAASSSVHTLLIFRFCAGIGLGGALPNVIALTAEYAPERRRATMITLMFVGFPFGAAVGGLLASMIIPVFGWRPVWYAGGALPLLLLPLQFLALPESLHTLIVNAAPRERIVALVRRLDPSLQIAADTSFQLAEARAPGLPVSHLFLERRALGTILIWIIFFADLLEIFISCRIGYRSWSMAPA
jgi:AAHS family 4-hydroxybenzoate transporter-like MFS transporter